MAQLSTLGTASSENFAARANPLREREIPRNRGSARRRAVGSQGLFAWFGACARVAAYANRFQIINATTTVMMLA
jgi:hypothetical protein